MSSLPDLETLRSEFQSQLGQAKTSEALDAVKVAWLGRKGRLTSLLKQLPEMALEERKKYGPLYNNLKAAFETSLTDAERTLKKTERSRALEQDLLDTTLPGTPYPRGHWHPLNQVMGELVGIFRSLGFVTTDGPEIESEYYNFEALNIPDNHPARDMQDTFYLQLGRRQLPLPDLQDGQARHEPVLLRTHTSPVQVRIMEKYPPPIAIIVPGRVYRHEAVDASHSAVFHQIEGLLVDEGISFADLKGTLSHFAQAFFGPSTKTRFRPSFFPFTEPSAEMDVSCFCGGTGCRACKNTGWIELLGSGMVNPYVLQGVKIDPEKYSGFAFGMGIERLSMLKYGVDDLRLFYENDLRFLRQF
jgi:phenylalanyl-tRNA synthetase alpha chain